VDQFETNTTEPHYPCQGGGLSFAPATMAALNSLIVWHRAGCRHSGRIPRKVTGGRRKRVNAPGSVPQPGSLELDDVPARTVWCNRNL
jgi:hypothetical protein